MVFAETDELKPLLDKGYDALNSGALGIILFFVLLLISLGLLSFLLLGLRKKFMKNDPPEGPLRLP